VSRGDHQRDPERVFARIHEYFEDTTQPPPPVEPGSSLAGDDAALGSLRVSHAAWFAWSLAVDHLEAVRALIEDVGQTQPWAHHTLLRSALETAVTAVWLLAPKQRDERVRRRLKLQGQEIYESERAQRLSGLTPAPPGRPPAERRDEVKKLASARGLDPNAVLSRFSYANVLREAAIDIPYDPDVLELIWMTGSGIAHGRSWATIAFLNREALPGDTDDVRLLKITASVEQLVLVAATGLLIVDRGRALYEAHRVRHY
jgi:hypothetical protein